MTVGRLQVTEALGHPIGLQATLHWVSRELGCPRFVLDWPQATTGVWADHQQLAFHALGQDDVPAGLALLGLTAECFSH